MEKASTIHGLRGSSGPTGRQITVRWEPNLITNVLKEKRRCKRAKVKIDLCGAEIGLLIEYGHFQAVWRASYSENKKLIGSKEATERGNSRWGRGHSREGERI
jgi:hypothetical protein